MRFFSNRIFKTAIITLFITSAFSQTRFKDVTAQAGINHAFKVYEGMFGGGACVIDYNNDGWEDLYLTGGMNDDVLYKNNGNGTFTNVFEQSGLPVTKQYVTQGVSGADVMIREIDGGGSSHMSQNSVIANFGLSNADKIDTITVYWTGGNKQTITNIKADQSITIKEIP